MASNSKGNAAIPQLATSELTLGGLVGQGGFSLVLKIEKVTLDEVYDTGEAESKLRNDFVESSKKNPYVLKTLRTDLPQEEYVKGIVDLAIEAEFLAVLSHPNIITMHAVANSDPHESRYFVILDQLVCTLDRKFNQWRREVSENSGTWCGPFGYCCAKEQFLYLTWLERIEAARDIANAISYLHSKSIAYRDLKPDNLGFDAVGRLKIFDFGLARRLNPNEKTEEGLYYLTGNTGSLRYMAPEVALGEPYDQRVDSYSFAILFWQICSLQTPYAGFTPRSHADKVVRQGHRPRIERSWPQSWADMMNRSWNSVKLERPDFDEIYAFFEEQVEFLKNSDGEVPTRASEIKAKKSRKPTAAARLDVDTRLSTADDTTKKRFENDVV